MIFAQAEETIFGDVRERNVCFLMDVSGSMYNKLAYVKEHLIELLKRRAIGSSDTMFNVISFKEAVDKWADRLVQCTTTTVNLAASWIRALSCGTSTDLLAALYEAVSDHAIEAIYMVTDGLPHHRATTILDHMQSVLRGVPVHSIYVGMSNHTDSAACDFLRDMAAVTRGSSHIVTLSSTGHVHRVRPIYNCGITPRYPGTILDPVTTASYHDLPYDTTTRANHIPLSSNMVPSNMPNTNYTTMNPEIMEYAEALNYTKKLAKNAGLAFSTTPAASSVMKGAKVLARNDTDGLYYLGEVKEQAASNDGTFVVKFQQCAALRKPRVQETHVRHMIAYQDAFRCDIALGDKVLSPWQRDGRYGPGTVLDGHETRTGSFSGERRDGLLVTFYNGETVNVEAGLAVRIPTTSYEQVTRDLQLPESQRRKLKYATEDAGVSMAYPDHIRASKRAWAENTLSDELWKQRIDEQLTESTHLLDALDLGRPQQRRDEIIGKATSSRIPEYDSGVFSSDDDDNGWRYDPLLYDDYGEPMFSKPRKKMDVGQSLRFSLPPEEKVTTKSGKDTEVRKPKWRHSGCGSGGGSAISYSPIHKTVLDRPKQCGDRLKTSPSRPAHQEYQTTTGVSFPEGTDRKFAQQPQSSTPLHERIPDARQKENDSTLRQPGQYNQHIEYQDVTGIRFPRKTDNKFTRSVDANWRPETAIENAEGRRTKGGGKGLRNGTKEDRSHKRGYFKEIDDKVALNEKKKERSVEFRRQKNMERIEKLMEADEMEDRRKLNRNEYKTAKKSEIIHGEQQRSGQVESWENTRIEYRRERLTRYLDTEEAHEARRDTREAVRQRRRRIKEAERRGEFDDRLREEWRTEDQKADMVRQKNEARREWEEKREQEGEEKKQARLAARQERLHKYRNRIFPG